MIAADLSKCKICGMPIGDHQKACSIETSEQHRERIEEAGKIAKAISVGLADAIRRANEASDRRLAERASDGR